MSFFRDQLEGWLTAQRVVADRVVDVGAGSNPARGRATVECREYLTLDVRPEADIVADLNEPLAADGEFDAAFCLEVFEYVWNPVQAHRNLARLLRPGGTLFVSYPFVYPIHNPAEVDYLRYTEQGVRRLLAETGFEVEELVPRLATRRRELLKFFRREGMHLRDEETALHIGYLVRARREQAP